MNRLLVLPATLLLLTACPEKRKELEEKRQEIINEVGGAPKRELDDVKQRVNAATDKAQERADRADAIKEDQ